MYKDKILKLLRSSKVGFISGEELARKCGISRTMVWKHVKSLERDGFGIEAVTSQGYRITSVPDILRLGDIKPGLKTRVIGKEIELLPEVTSTNTLAMERASKGARGHRRDRRDADRWQREAREKMDLTQRESLSQPGSATGHPDVQGAAYHVDGCSGCCFGDKKAVALETVIKWPNILVSGRKVSGLLTEMSAEQDRIRHIVLGIGVDVNMDLETLPSEVRVLATTLAAASGKTIDRTVLLRQLLRDLDRWYRIFLSNGPEVLREWKSLNLTIGNRVAVSGAGETLEGLARGIDEEGRLVIMLDDGTVRTVAAGDVTIVKKS
jgi:BirA family biotin operon repressor/biotin-[acetyl-CoA-carboxylase] ligase